jgi:sterol desaturase/sphingolipid hydroxylase (fatty acid hydroxylase superfamily)
MDVTHVTGFLIEHKSFQAFLFIFVMVSTWLIETSIRAEPAGGKLRHTAANAIFILTALPIQLVMMALCAGVAEWVTTHRWGLVYLLPGADNPWIKYGLMFVVLDLLDYVYHVTMHKVPQFWRFHLTHHSDRALDVSTTVREHPGETVVRNLFLISWVFLCGASIEILLLRQTTETVSNILSHTSFRLPERAARVIGWVFITPNLHQSHHHFQLPATNCNYGDIFSVWDRLFGTYIDLPKSETVFGLDTHMDGSTMGLPFGLTLHRRG